MINSAIYGTISTVQVLQTPEFSNWFETQKLKDRAQIDARVARLEEFDHLGDWKNLGNGLAELRWKSGRRIYFGRVGDKVILLLNGGTKNAQKKDVKKQDSSLKDMQKVQIKKGVKLSSFGATKRMRDKEYIAKSLWECLVANDPDGFKEVLKTHLELANKEDLVEATGISRRTLFRMLSEQGNPTLDNISKLVNKLCA